MSPASDAPLCGRSWRAVVNGRRALNGARHSITLSGHIEQAEPGSTIFDVMLELADHIEARTADMEIKDSFQITLYSP